MTRLSPLTIAFLSFALVGCSDRAKDKVEQNTNTAVPTNPVVAKAPQPKPVETPTLNEDTKNTLALQNVAQPDVEPVALEIVPETFRECRELGRELMNSNAERSLTLLLRAKELRPKNVVIDIDLARVSLNLGQLEKARNYIEPVLENMPDSSLAWNTLGRVELAERDFYEAIEAFTHATQTNPDNLHAWNNLGYTQLLVEEYEDALESLVQATSFESATAYMWNNLGMAHEHLDEIQNARDAYELAVNRGSVKAKDNFARLEGVTSLVAAGVDNIDDEHAFDLALLEEPENLD